MRNEKYAKKWFEDHDEELAGGWDAIKRDQELDGDGVRARSSSPTPTPSRAARACRSARVSALRRLDPVLGMAGAKAHNRWLAELCAHSPRASRGVALVPITGAIDEALAEIRARQDHGLGAVMIPALWCNQPPYHDRALRPGVGAVRRPEHAGA